MSLAAALVALALGELPVHAAPILWASEVVALERGPERASDPASPPASFGSPADALGAPDGAVVSLGEGGSIVVAFPVPFADGPGIDLVVHENPFLVGNLVFAELGFVEVSSDGVTFARFPARSAVPGPVDTFGTIDPAWVEGFAGVAPGGDGFDLAALPPVPGVDLAALRYVRIVDVPGDGSVRDADGRPVYDPYPTPFPSSGFDLDAVGALHPVPEPRAAAPAAVAAAALLAVARRRPRRRADPPASRRRAGPRAGTALALALAAGPAAAQVAAAPGWIHAPVPLAQPTQSCVAAAPGGTFVGLGPGFTPNGQAVGFVLPSGRVALVATGFASIGDCAYDAATDTLYVTDNGLEAPGGALAGSARTGDTVYAIAGARAAAGVDAAEAELLPAGSVPTAASVAIAPDGTLRVSDAAGGGAGSVLAIDPATSPPAAVPFATGLDFAGGLAVEPDGTLVVAETAADFSTRIRRFAPDGTELAPLCTGCPSGSYDLARLADGRILATGHFGGTVFAYDAGGDAEPFASGLGFPTGIDVDPVTGRVDALASFTFDARERAIHAFVPVARLAPGRGRAETECAHELYGVATEADGRTVRCRDGDPCDADGRADGACTFPIGFCLALDDARFPECAPDAVASVELRVKPPLPGVEAMRARLAAALPANGPRCVRTDGLAVPVRRSRAGDARPGRARLLVRATRAGDGRTDTDAWRLLCEPAAP